MVKGLDTFKEYFAGFSDRYVLIGGTAATIAMSELGAEFRATKDLDIVLCVEALDKEFAVRFWDFIKAGGYSNRQTSSGERRFYRFHNPKEKKFPVMLELFSRVPDAITIGEDAHLTPIPIGDEVSSLSAILLNDEYYRLIQESKRVFDGLTIIGAECLIPLKARAYLDLSDRNAAGSHVDSGDIRKHRNDIYRLFPLLDPQKKPAITDGIKDDLRKSFTRLTDDPVDLQQFDYPKTATVAGILRQMKEFYALGN
jgi:hypothetical protein